MASKLREVNVTLQTLQNDSNCSEPHAFFTRGEIGPSHVSDFFFSFNHIGLLVCESKVDPKAITEIQ